MKKLMRVLLSVLLSVTAAWSQAALITWELRDVRFNDGGILTGFFVLELGARACQPMRAEKRRTAAASFASAIAAWLSSGALDVLRLMKRTRRSPASR